MKNKILIIILFVILILPEVLSENYGREIVGEVMVLEDTQGEPQISINNNIEKPKDIIEDVVYYAKKPEVYIPSLIGLTIIGLVYNKKKKEKNNEKNNIGNIVPLTDF